MNFLSLFLLTLYISPHLAISSRRFPSEETPQRDGAESVCVGVGELLGCDRMQHMVLERFLGAGVTKAVYLTTYHNMSLVIRVTSNAGTQCIHPFFL